MFANTFAFLLETIVHLFVLAALTRFYAQALRAPFGSRSVSNPITDFVVALTDFAIKPMRRVIPGVLGLDIASLLAAWLAESLLVAILLTLNGVVFGQGAFFPSVLLMSLLRLFKLSIYLLIGVLVVQALLSWTNPYHPLMGFFNALTRPFLNRLRQWIPLVGGVDLSPLVLILACQVVLMWPLALAEHRVAALAGVIG